MLAGSEVKSLRAGQASIVEAYVTEKNGEVFLINGYIAPYEPAKTFGHEPRRVRKLLMHRREIDRLSGAVRRQGMTLVPLSLYFNARGTAKLSIGLAKGKRKVDVRQAEKDREWKRDKARLLRTRG